MKSLKEETAFQKFDNLLHSKGDNSKLVKLLEILESFFTLGQAKNSNSRVIVFTQYRQSAGEIKDFIDANQDKEKKVVRADIFVGVKGKEMNQKLQKARVIQFK